MKIKDVWMVSLLILGTGCAAMNPTSSNSSYSEDLSVHRPEVNLEVQQEIQQEEPEPVSEPEYDQTAKVDQKLDAITSQNKSSRTTAGFTIQVYSGTSREQASQAKSQVYRILPESRPETKYEQPIYRVRVGEFGDRLEAQNTYAELQKEFPQAIVIPSRIRIN